MGDRCYMQIFCRREDRHKFDDLFTGHDGSPDGQPGVIMLSEMEANYAYGVGALRSDDSGELPNDVPYYGGHGEGCEFGAGEFACDGQEFRYVTSGRNCYEIRFDKEGNPNQDDIEEVRQFVLFKKKVEAMLAEPAPPVENPPVISITT